MTCSTVLDPSETVAYVAGQPTDLLIDFFGPLVPKRFKALGYASKGMKLYHKEKGYTVCHLLLEPD